MIDLLIKNALIVNEGSTIHGHLLIDQAKIRAVIGE